MHNTTLLLRAITSVFFRRLLKRALLFGGLVAALVCLLVVLLALKISSWWLIALALVIPAVVLGIVVALTLWILAGQLAPRKLSRKEAKEIQEFSDRLLEVADRVREPWPVLLFSIARSVLLRRESNVLSDTINDSKALRADFIRLRDSFNQ